MNCCKFKKLGVRIPEILMPARGINLTKWAVIACDQYTSQPEYWEKVRYEVDGSPSTLNLIFPEIYLKDGDSEARINRINETMEQYLRTGILQQLKPGFILVDRSTPRTASRKGLILAVDLECYDYAPGSRTIIRATEGTVIERIPPRVKIRENAPIELPHIMLLIDDPGKTVIEKLYAGADQYEKLYDFELMQGGGHVIGWKVDDAESLSMIADALEKLADPQAFKRKYGMNGNAADPGPYGGDVMLFAVGDGNHSLAAAKAHWEKVKQKLQNSGAVPEHPARYALVEVVNLHDDGLVFEPIHRVVFGIDSSDVLDRLMNACSQLKAECRLFDSRESLESELHRISDIKGKSIGNGASRPDAIHLLPFILEGTYGLITVYNPPYTLEVGTLQAMLDRFAADRAGAGGSAIEIDYIHGRDVVTALGSKQGCMGFYLPAMSKHNLFKTVITEGVLPRKSFSMGEAEEKRYYLEGRHIK